MLKDVEIERRREVVLVYPEEERANDGHLPVLSLRMHDHLRPTVARDRPNRGWADSTKAWPPTEPDEQ